MHSRTPRLHSAAMIEVDYDKLTSEFIGWRRNEHAIKLKNNPDAGRILHFVKGLHFSALLIYQIRIWLSGSGLKVDWGHIFHSTQGYCSRECDIIIHTGGINGRWNGQGGDHPIMDFKFVFSDHVKAVISCKAFVKPSNIDKTYCESIKKYTDNIWLFAEYCGPESHDAIRQEAQISQYQHFWCLYSMNQKGDINKYMIDWYDFHDAVMDLKGLFVNR